jgi:hypothetical protein
MHLPRLCCRGHQRVGGEGGAAGTTWFFFVREGQGGFLGKALGLCSIIHDWNYLKMKPSFWTSHQPPHLLPFAIRYVCDTS